MPSRRHSKRAHVTLSVDLLADWRPFANALPASENFRDWQLYGTVTIDGKTGGLGWKPGGYAIVTGNSLRELSMWERIDLSSAVDINKPPGYETRPQYSMEAGWGSVYMRDVG